MFTLRAAQIEALEKDRTRQFHDRVASLVRQHLPEPTETMPQPTLLATIAAADNKARSYGIRTERGIVEFVALTIVAGTSVDTIPEVHALLTIAPGDPDHKVHQLVRSLTRT